MEFLMTKAWWRWLVCTMYAVSVRPYGINWNAIN